MSGGEALGRVRDLGPEVLGREYPVPLDPSDGAVQAHITGGSVSVAQLPTVTIYDTGTGAADAFSVIPPAAIPATLSAVYARNVGAVPRWIQVFKGQLPPAPGAKPFLVGDIITPVGGNTQWTPPDEVERDPALSNGYVIITSSTQATYTDTGIAELSTVALGRQP